MSTLVVAYHYYRPYNSFRSTDYLLFLYLSYERSLGRLLAQTHDYLFGSIGINDLMYHEKSASENDGNATAPSIKEASLLDEPPEPGFSFSGGGNSPKKKGGVTEKIKGYKKRIVIAGGVVSVTVAITGAIVVAPSFLMTHISSLIMDKAGDLQARQSATFRRTKYAKFTDRFSIEGRRGGALIKDMERFGYTFEFDGVDKNKLAKMSKLGNPIDPSDFDKEIAGYMDSRYKLFGASTRSGRWKTNRMNAFYNRYKIPNTSIVRPVVEGDDAKTELNKRNFEATDRGEAAGKDVEPPQRNQYPDTDEGKEAYDKALEEFNEADIDPPSNSALADTKAEIAEGVDVDDTDARVFQGLSEGDGDSIVRTKPLLDDPGFASKGFGFIKGVLNPTDVVDKGCSAARTLQAAVTVARAVNSVKLMRAATTFVTADDGQRKREASADMVKELMKRVTLSDASLGTFASAQGYSKIANGTFSRNTNEQTRTPFAVDGKLSGFWGELKDILTFPGSTYACPVVQNPGFQVAQGVAVIVASVFSGGTAGGAAAGAGTAAKEAVEFGVSSLIKRQVVNIIKGVALGVAIDLTFEQILSLTQVYVEQTLELPFTGQETGGRYASILFAGAGVLHKQRNLRAGFIPATSRVFAEAQNDYLSEIAAEKANKSFFARIFDINDTDSLAHKSFADLAFQAVNPSRAIENKTTNIANIPNLFASIISGPIVNLAVDRTYAQQDMVSYDTLEINGLELATDPYGSLETIMPDWLFDYSDPVVEEENTNFLISAGHIDPDSREPKSDEFKEHIENCVDSTDTISVLEQRDAGSKDVKTDCMANEDLTKRFKGHLVNFDSSDLLEAELFPQEISSSGGGGGAPSQTNGTSIDLSQGLIKTEPFDPASTPEIACPISPTVEDLGLEQNAYAGGIRYTIRLCRVHGVRVNSIVAKKIDDLFNEMASNGYTVDGTGGFRDHASQIRGYDGGAGAGTFARPGFSNHQFGVAFDLSCQGGGTPYPQGTGRGRESFLANVSNYPCLKWISENSPRYGIFSMCVAQGSNGQEIRANSGGCEWWHFSPTGG
jgi:hypothetical protein